jgi:hypothetical protein
VPSYNKTSSYVSSVHVWVGEFGGGACVCMCVYKDAAAEAACAGPLEPPLRVGADGDAVEGVDDAGDASDAVAELHEDLTVGSEADADAPTPAPDLFVAASGGAASSGAPPPPPPPAHEALYPANAIVTFFVEGSAKIVSYLVGFVEVTCTNPAHGRCRVTRSMKSAGPRTILRNPGQGRPLGFAVAWLLDSSSGDIPDRHSHLAHRPSWARRQAARAWLRGNGAPAAAALLARERPRRVVDEPSSEPEFLEG